MAAEILSHPSRVALYARVSTANGQQNPELQLSELREYVRRRGWIIAEEYVDHGVSGAKESRPALNRMMADAQRRRFDILLCWKLDRFARSLKFLVVSLAELASLGVAFVSLRDNLDLTTPAGRLMAQLLGAMAEFERELIRERVCAGLRNARRNGKRIGRPRTSLDMRRVTELRSDGWGWNRIARELEVGPGTVLRAAQRAGLRYEGRPDAVGGAFPAKAS